MKRERRLKICLAMLFLVLCEAFFFRNILLNDLMFGDTGDGRLTMLLTEHWYDFLCRKQGFAELPFFYPAENVLAYSDMFLGYGVIHAVLRALGVNLFLAFKITVITIHFLGIAACFFLLVHSMQTDIFWGLIGTMVFGFSTIYASFMNHPQLAAMSLVPVTAIPVLGFVHNIEHRAKRNIYAYTSIVLLELILYTAWYTAFFTALFAVIYVVIRIIYLAVADRESLQVLWKKIRRIGIDFPGYFLAAISLAVPFVMLELPLMKRTGGRPYDVICSRLPGLLQAFRRSTNDFLALKLFGKDHAIFQISVSGELVEGLSPLVFLLFLATFIFGVVICRKENPGRLQGAFWSLGMTVIVSIFLTMRFGTISLWKIVYDWFPGGRSIRAVSRYYLFLTLPIGISIAVFGTAFTHRIHRIRAVSTRITEGLLGGGLLILVFLDNISLSGIPGSWNIGSETAYLESLHFPPAECEVFFVINSSDQEMEYYEYQTLAYEIADHFGIKTINGYSGLTPTGWKKMRDVKEDTYLEAVGHWIQKNGLQGVFCLDLATGEWKLSDEMMRMDP